jgi:hypothetical protein
MDGLSPGPVLVPAFASAGQIVMPRSGTTFCSYSKMLGALYPVTGFNRIPPPKTLFNEQ